MARRTTTQTVATIAFAFLVSFALLQTNARAAGEQFGASQDDFQISVDYRWTGGTVGGYYPIRIGLQNRGPTRELEVTFRPSSGSQLPVATRRISIDQNSSASFTLLIPMTGPGNYGSLRVTHRGRRLEKLENRITLPSVDVENARPAILVISPAPLDLQPLEDAITSLIPISRHHHHSVTLNNQTIEPFRLPDNWLAYSCVDMVAISLETLAELPDPQTAALLDWTRTGGTLLVHSVGEPASKSRSLAQTTAADQQSQSTDWRPADSKLRTRIREVHLDEHGNMAESSGGDPVFMWANDEPPFEIRVFGQGRLIGFSGNPFSGSIQDWGWMLKSMPVQHLRYGKRLGVAGRIDNEEFLEFLIPNIRSVPVMAFLIFISLFSFVIGPLNYFVLSRKGRLNYLVVTIPAVAIVTSLCLFGYSALSHGFSVKSRVRSLTFIDQGHKKSVSTARLAFYAGMSPSNGLSFSPTTAVMPIRPSGENFESARTDWSDTQSLRSGWLRSRTRTQFLTRSVRPERGRLTVGTMANGKLPVTNGLEWAIESMIVVDEDGASWFASDLTAGSGKALAPLSDQEKTAFVKLLDRSAPAIPQDLENSQDVVSLNMGSRMMYRYYGRSEQFRVSEGQTERTIATFRQDVVEGNQLPSNTYYAILKEAPSIEFGTEVDVVDSWHMVIGYY